MWESANPQSTVVESFAPKREHDANDKENEEAKTNKNDAITDRVMILVATPEVVAG